MREVLGDDPNDRTYTEVNRFIDALNEDRQLELITLLRIGRGDFSAKGWPEVCDEAA